MTYAETVAPFVDRCHYGDARQVLDTLPEASAHCVVTSPPYWLQRDYGTGGQVWGGDPECEHEWSSSERGWNNRHAIALARGHEGAIKGGSANHRDFKLTDNVCMECGAWFGQFGLEPTPQLFVSHMVEVFREVRRVLRDDGVLFLNLGDSYAGGKGGGGKGGEHGQQFKGNQVVPPGLKPKDLVGIPWRVAFALQADGWWLRSDIIWHKPSPMPESVTDRPTKAHEHIFLLAKSARYFYDADAVREAGVYSGPPKPGHRAEDGYPGQIPRAGNLGRPAETGRNARDVWTITTKPYAAAHFAVSPPEIPKRCIQAGTSERGACAECGAPWERVVERTPMVVKPGPGRLAKQDANGEIARTACGGTMTQAPTSTTTGWRPTCDHDAPAVPCVVLDPFLGSGTTAQAAQDLGRRWLGCELNPEYAPLIDKRTAQLGLFAAVRP